MSQHATAGSATMVNGGITEREAKSIATGDAGVTEEQIQYITVKQDWDDAVPDMRWNSPRPEWSTIMSWMHPTDASYRQTRSDRQGIPCITGQCRHIAEWHGGFTECDRHIADNTGRCFHRDSKTDRHGQDPRHRCRKHLHPSGL